MNGYTYDDLIVLNNIANLVSSDAGTHAPTITMTAYTEGVAKLYKDEDIRGYPIDLVIEKFMRFLAFGEDRDAMNHLIYEEPLENVPLYINKKANIGSLARWRLKIGK